MGIFYDDSPAPFTGRRSDPAKLPATRFYLDHYSNYLILDRISLSPKDATEKRQAIKELTICEKKLEFWRRHPNFDRAAADRGVASLKAAWASPR